MNIYEFHTIDGSTYLAATSLTEIIGDHTPADLEEGSSFFDRPEFESLGIRCSSRRFLGCYEFSKPGEIEAENSVWEETPPADWQEAYAIWHAAHSGA